MAKQVSMKHKRLEAPTWIFPWRRSQEPFVFKLLALVITTGIFVFLLTSVRIRVVSPVPWAASKAVVIQALDDVDGRALALRAREGGPFPSRFELESWEPGRAILNTAYQKVRWQPPIYAPTLKPLPDEPSPIWSATIGEPVLPNRPLVIASVIQGGHQELNIELRPLSRNAISALPTEVPPFDGELPPAAQAFTWRFLLRLNAQGAVLDCISLAGGDDQPRNILQSWLRRIPFQPAESPNDRWVAVGLGFTYQQIDGTNTR